jgi:hypothetical protein
VVGPEAPSVVETPPGVRRDPRELCPEKRKAENDGLYGEGGNLRGAATGVFKVETCSLAFSLIEMRQFVPPQFPSTVGYRGLVYPVVPAGDATKMRPVAASKWVILARH